MSVEKLFINSYSFEFQIIHSGYILVKHKELERGFIQNLSLKLQEILRLKRSVDLASLKMLGVYLSKNQGEVRSNLPVIIPTDRP